MTSDQQLLEDFARSGSERAFRMLVERHLDLVHSVARRVTQNNDLARDVAQAVFVKLATRPDSVPQGINLLAWLHRTTRHKAIDLVRSENRRRRREQIAITIQQDEMTTPDLDWKELEPVIDEALSKLPANDRSLVLARYYQKRSHAATAENLGITEDAARMRTKRALGKLRGALGKQGIATSASLLGTVMVANAISPAPATLSAAVCKSGLAAAAKAGAGSGVTATTGSMLKANLAAVAALAVGVPVVALQYSENKSLGEDIKVLEAKINAQPTPIAVGIKPPSALSSTQITHGKALLQILADPDPIERLNSLLAYINKVETDEVHPVLVALRENSAGWDPDARIAARMLLARWGKTDPDAAFDYVESLDYTQGVGDAFVVLDVLAATDPQHAVAWLNEPQNKLAHLPTMSKKLAGTIAREWALQDPDAAFAWAKGTPDAQRPGALSGLFGTLASDPIRATTLAMNLEPGNERSEIIGKIAETWGRRSPDEAIAWVESLEGDEHQQGLNRALAGWSWTAPAEAATYIDTLPREEGSGTLVRTIAESWARQDPASAAEWVASQDESEDASRALGHVMWNWAVADPGAASSWLLEQPPGPARDSSVAGLAKATYPEDPAGAASWAASIDNPEVRNAILDESLQSWLTKSPVEAREWLESSDVLTAEDIARNLRENSTEE